MTRYEWIRSRNPEELATFIVWLVDYETDLPFNDYVKSGELDEVAVKDWIEWMHQEKSNG